MEYADEGNLNSLIDKKIKPFDKNKNKWKESKILSIFVRLLLGLKEIHSKKIIHRDIKHLNILLFKNGQVKLWDFGVWKEGDLGETNIILGEFTAPEVRQSKANYRNPVDVYSLGQVLYYWMFFKNSPPLAKEEKDNNHEDSTISLTNIPRRLGISNELCKIWEEMIRRDPRVRININDILK